MRHPSAIAFLCLFAVCATLTANAQKATWTDLGTNLMWEGSDTGVDVTWQQAADYCRNLKLSGYSNWRLPTVDELRAIYDPNAHQPGVCCSDKHAVDYRIKGNLHLTEGGIDWSSTPGNAPGKMMDYIFSFDPGASLSDSVDQISRRAICVRNVLASIAATPHHPATAPNQTADALNKQALNLYLLKNYDEAFKLYSASSKMGNANAEYYLGLFYLNGYSVPKDIAQARSLFLKASSQGYGEAKKALDWLNGQPSLDSSVAASRLPLPPEKKRQADELYRQAQDFQAKRQYDDSFRLFSTLAAMGRPEGQHGLGLHYLMGWSVPKDPPKAMAWFQNAAAQGFIKAYFNIGSMYRDGEGVQKDSAQAISWFKKGADQGDSDGLVLIGTMYERGTGVPQDFAQAITWYEKAGALGNDSADIDIGSLYDTGVGVPKDPAQAIAWYQKGADQDHVNIQIRLGEMYLNGEGTAKDTPQAISWFQKAAAQNSPIAFKNLGNIYLNGVGVPVDYKQAMAWYLKAAQQGNAEAEYEIGWSYEGGMGVNQDNQQALSWYQKAAALDFAPAQLNLGTMYYKGEGTAQDYVQSFNWFLRAAQRNTLAQYNLAQQYYKGEGTAQNLALALAWYKRASNFAPAQFSLGTMYFKGEGTARDYKEAKDWYQKSADQGNADAKNQLVVLERIMAPPVVAVAQPVARPQSAPNPQPAARPQPVADSNQSQIASLTQRINDLQSSAGSDEMMAAAVDMQASQQSGFLALGEQLIARKYRSNANKERAQADQLRSQLVALQGSDAGANSNRHSIFAAAGEGLATAAETQNVDPNASRSALANNATEGTLNYMANGTPTVVDSLVSGADTTPEPSTAACSNDPTYTANVNQLRANPTSQAPAYRAAAALCQCYINADPTNPSRSQWQQCVNNNNASLRRLGSNAPAVGGGVMPSGNVPGQGNVYGQTPNNCAPGMIGCAGVAK